MAGIARGRRLGAPKGTATRPTTDKVREAILAMVGSRLDLGGAVVADLFAGSGAMGIEALSRGAAEAVFVDSATDAIRTIRANLNATGLKASGMEATVVRADVLRYLLEHPRRFDVVFADPPYAWSEWGELFARIDASLLVAESDRAIEPPADWRVLKVSPYGDTVVTLASHASPR